MTEDLREAVARAMCYEGGFDPDEMIFKSHRRWHAYLKVADAAIAAVVERCAATAEQITAEQIQAALTVNEKEIRPEGVHQNARIVCGICADEIRALARKDET